MDEQLRKGLASAARVVDDVGRLLAFSTNLEEVEAFHVRLLSSWSENEQEVVRRDPAFMVALASMLYMALRDLELGADRQH